MDGIKNEHFDWPARYDVDGMAVLEGLGRTSPMRKVMLTLLLICIRTPVVVGQRYHHRRLWPPANIEPCVIQCPEQHVQMVGNRSSGAELSQWGPQPIFDFMSNGHLQKSTPPLRPMTTTVDVAAASGMTTLMTSLAGPTQNQETSFPRSAAPMEAVSAGKRTFDCDIMFQVAITLSCMWIALLHGT